MTDLTAWGIFTSLWLGLIIYTLLSTLHTYYRLGNIPGPNPFIPPNIFAGIALPVKHFKDLAKKHGRIYLYWPGWIFTKPMVFIADVKAVRQVLTDVKTFTKGPDYTVRFAVGLGKGLVTTVGEEHKKMRGCCTRFFVKKSIDKLVPIIQKNVYRLFEDLELVTTGPDGIQNIRKGNEDFNIMYFCHALTFRSISNIVYGGDLSYCLPYEKEIMEDISMGQRIIGTRIFFKAPILEFDPSVKHIRDRLQIYYAVFDRLVEERKRVFRSSDEKTKNEEPDDILRMMIDEKIPRIDMYEQIQTIIFAGFETTSTFLSYALYRIAKFPLVQERIREEVLDLMGDRTELTPDDLPKLKYLSCVFKECMRWLAIIPALTRVTTKDVDVTTSDGKCVRIPKDADIILPFYLLNFSEDVWKNPNDFVPERMEVVPDLQSVRHGFLPFSYGTRSCVGNLLAFQESQVAVAHLLRNFRLDRVDGFRPNTTLGISTVSSNGMRLKLVAL
uniref:Cytochrome P450 n=1 Tax=Proboscia inermis TaxID=420281 RepID=A0A7S0BVI0_9STRA|mmetsp:Transcript_11934/g.11979  ORF Transcript_11934/g.11979 Transcript_11934/m.11979 type:complete len:499 (+) Transcript_11934:71-1567(+)|eukprot:CAMPEP_0194378276 /NCGR_PEP_ID=MMETSP0174-20130528/34498_1 /TAXON_ID=216777 /ORGANISM="Proboscia alata, Strain PI-D3" /LENGTH=498 /DNA_ID=CAMNT_0039160153 /DNA_START=131 /DNA_END=1627 /DNA_ORIENTATION=+